MGDVLLEIESWARSQEIGPGLCSLVCLLLALVWWLLCHKSAVAPNGAGTASRHKDVEGPKIGTKTGENIGVDPKLLEELGAGVYMRKFGRRGRPRECVVRVEKDCVTWSDPKHKVRLCVNVGVHVSTCLECVNVYSGC
jgi:hypothetical protein